MRSLTMMTIAVAAGATNCRATAGRLLSHRAKGEQVAGVIL
jgi:hypothetical protein